MSGQPTRLSSWAIDCFLTPLPLKAGTRNMRFVPRGPLAHLQEVLEDRHGAGVRPETEALHVHDHDLPRTYLDELFLKPFEEHVCSL